MCINDSDVTVIDENDIVDHIYFEMSPFSPGSAAATLQENGVFGNGRLEARFSVQCSPNFFGEDCNLTSIPTVPSPPTQAPPPPTQALTPIIGGVVGGIAMVMVGVVFIVLVVVCVKRFRSKEHSNGSQQ